MTIWRYRWLFIILMVVGPCLAADIPFVFEESSSDVASKTADQLESISRSSLDLAGVSEISSPEDDEYIETREIGGVSVDLTVGDLRRLFDARTEPNNEYVHRKALVLAAKYPGSHNIKQICSIFEYLNDGDRSTKGWSYVNEARGGDFYSFANYTLRVGEEAGCTGAGDCDDFAILMSSLVESVGGTTRVIFSTNDTRGESHAYTEVYLGTLGDPDSEVEEIIGWLMQKYSTRKIFAHIDTDTSEVWLNLDWSASHPGGHFYEGSRHVLILIRNDAPKTSLKAPGDYVPTPDETGSGAPTVSVAFSPDGHILASGSGFGQITLWDIDSRTAIRHLDSSGRYCCLGDNVAFSPNGRILASTSDDPAGRLWDAASWTEIGTLKGSVAPFSIAFSPDGSILATDESYFEDNILSGSRIMLWDVASQTEIGVLAGHSEDWVFSVAFSPDGLILATGSGDSTIKLWNVARRTEVGALTGHSGNVMSVAFSPDGHTLASGSNDNTIKLWDVASRTEIATLVGHSGSVLSVAFSPDGRTLASGGGCGDCKVRLWDVASRTEIEALAGHSGPVFSVAFSPDGRTLASAGSSDCTVKLWDVADRTEIATLGVPKSPEHCGELTPESSSNCRTPDSKKCQENVDRFTTI